jgi:hypothetical protein
VLMQAASFSKKDEEVPAILSVAAAAAVSEQTDTQPPLSAVEFRRLHQMTVDSDDAIQDYSDPRLPSSLAVVVSIFSRLSSRSMQCWHEFLGVRQGAPRYSCYVLARGSLLTRPKYLLAHVEFMATTLHRLRCAIAHCSSVKLPAHVAAIVVA